MITKRLKTYTPLALLIGQRVYDRVPRDASGPAEAAFPYVSWGPEQEIPDDAECIPGSEFILQLDAWSRGVGFTEVKRIANGIKAALDDEAIEINENALVYLTYEGRRVLRDTDGLTSHAVLTLRACVEFRIA